MLLSDIINAMEAIAPKDTALDFDNPGLIVGTRNKEISRVLVALDCTVPVVHEAADKDCRLIITHHPLLFRGAKHITPEDPVTAPVFELISNGIAMFAAHTNLDAAEGGVNTALCRLLGIKDERPVPPEDLCRVGELEQAMSFEAFARLVEERLSTRVRVSGPEREIRRVMVCGGSGGSEYPLAASVGADVLVTGECKHNEALEAAEAGVNIIAAGHFETEAVVLRPLIARLRELTEGVEYIHSDERAALRSL